MPEQTTNWYVCSKCGSCHVNIIRSQPEATICKCKKCQYKGNDFKVESSGLKKEE